MSQYSIGIIGLGLLGSAIAERLAAAGFAVVGYDIDGVKTRAATRFGMAPAGDPAAVAAQCRRVILSLPNSGVVEHVVEGPEGLLDESRAKDIFIDTTTADPVSTRNLASKLRRRGIVFIDATVLGSSQQAREGDVIVMTGGEQDAAERCRDLFDSFANRVFHMGESGRGAETKLIVNLVLGLNRLVLAEALVLGRKAGVDLDALIEVLKSGAAYSTVMDTKGRKMIDGEFGPQARLSQHLKDVGLILELGARSDAPLLLSALHAQLLRAGVAAGYGDEDNSAIIKVLERLASEPG